MSLISIQNIGKKYGDLTILNNVNLSAEPKTIVAITGPSGSGKSTLLHIMGLMDSPSEGRITLNNQDLNLLSDTELSLLRLNKIGFLFQFHYLIADMTVLENVLIPTKIARDSKSDSLKRAKDLLNRMGLDKRLDHRPAQLSGGEQQRTAFARAIIRNPQLLLCDEPTGNLDSHNATLMMNCIAEETKNSNMATIFVTHNMELANKADMSYHLVDGQLSQ